MQPTTSTPTNLADYVRFQFAQGQNSSYVTAQLSAQNWTEQQISSVIASVQAEGQSQSQAQPQADPQFQNQPQPATQLQSADRQQPAAAVQSAMINHTETMPLQIAEIIFTVGFASIFIVNGIVAWLNPHDFIVLLTTFPIAAWIGHVELMVVLAGVNDVLLGLLILSRRWKPYVLAYAGAWLALVTLIKLFTLV